MKAEHGQELSMLKAQLEVANAQKISERISSEIKSVIIVDQKNVMKTHLSKYFQSFGYNWGSSHNNIINTERKHLSLLAMLIGVFAYLCLFLFACGRLSSR